MITPENEFQYFHAYNDLAKEAKVPFLSCPCGAMYVTMSEDYRLVLWCPVEDYTITPGARMLYEVETVVKACNKEI